jgi:hypothetical protein
VGDLPPHFLNMDYFKKEEEFIKTLIKKTGLLFSTVIVETATITPEDLITRDNFTTEYLESIWLPMDKKIFHFEGIFKNKSDIYLYLSKYDNGPYRLKIIYEISKLDEVTLFIKQLSKLK